MMLSIDQYIESVHEGKKPYQYSVCDSNVVQEADLHTYSKHLTRIYFMLSKNNFVFRIFERPAVHYTVSTVASLVSRRTEIACACPGPDKARVTKPGPVLAHLCKCCR